MGTAAETEDRRTERQVDAVLRRIRESDPQLRDLLALYLFVKAALILVALLGNHLLPFNWQLYTENLVQDLQGLPEVFRPFNTWDTQHYLLLSQRGYGVNPMSNAFYPLFPYLIWVFTPFFFNKGLIAAWVIANAVSLLVPVYMYKLCCLFWTREQAFRSTVLLLAFPTAFFLSTAYSESLYLAIGLMAFYYLFTQDVWKSCVLCFLFPLARAQALLFLVPLTIIFFQSAVNGKGDAHARVTSAARTFLPPMIATVLGMAVYFGFCWWQLGGPFEGLKAQQLYVSNNSLGNVVRLDRWFTSNFVNITLQLHGYANSMIDRAAFILCAPLLVGVYRTQNKALFAYAALTLLIPAFAGTFMSYTRVLMVVFPLSIYLGTRAIRTEYLAIPMFAVQVLFYLLHTGGYWVA
jgi:Mannosyltransferase (PIG-V)